MRRLWLMLLPASVIVLPGEVERTRVRDRLAAGIAIDRITDDRLGELAQDFANRFISSDHLTQPGDVDV